VQLVRDVVHVAPPLAVAVYSKIGEPPSEAGADQEMIDSLIAPSLAVTDVGALGFPAVLAEAEADATESPFEFVALTVNV
jgi:hypothetical protein